MLLHNISSPKDLKKLTISQLVVLSNEIRSFLLQSLKMTGGHLASNLGIVELTLALHKIFASPSDKFLFDVGHQTYVHKILTGRRDQFVNLRQRKGLSGFPKRNESPHDAWETGHSSTSLSAAAGMAVARDLRGEKHNIIAVIGDGAMTGGMALEALNHIGEEQRNMLLVLNDNAMSISPNVGALQNHLARLRTHPGYNRFKKELEHFLHRIPTVGQPVVKTLEKLKDGLKYLLVSGVFFETLGFTYLGPVNGHSLPDLLGILKLANQTKGPVLLHVITKKGQGYKPAEEDAVFYHGVSADYKIEFKKQKDVQEQKTPTYPVIFGQTLLKMAQINPRLVIITPAMLTGSKLDAVHKAFPERVFDVGIAEQHALTFAAGLANDGFIPLVSIYATFLQRAYDQFIHDICLQKLPVVLAVDRAGFVGEDGETHQGVYDISFLRNQPGLTIMMMPKDENELQHMLYTAVMVAKEKGPVVVRYSKERGLGVTLDNEFKMIEIGKSEVVFEGNDIILLGLGTTVYLAQQAAKKLALEGISVRVINMRFVKPLDEEMLLSIYEDKIPLIIIEEGIIAGGLGSSILEFYVLKKLQVSFPVRLMGIDNKVVEHGSIEDQRIEVGLTVDNILNEVKSLL